ncbi:5-formyltetrahydrofolate cyclo-ligase [uncultured Roseibium sp.]|uniref:5-formyltetrahydrofolate cyclo-ligase n=1 Tax=uncultured Roseibium sp. TaxID=1936171 RepID=UPI002635609B|nr:5-formyltetrahydrofolate cyclo-ligase [uncultured Roseibium sp.]
MTEVSDPAAEKDRLRKQALSRRKELDEVERIEKSLQIVDHHDALPLPSGAIVAGFWPIRDEIDPRPLLDRLRQRGHRLGLPVMVGPSLIFRHLQRDTELVPAGFGCLEPGPEAEELRPDVLLMPLAGFDNSGNRIGYGRAYYDNTIALLENSGPVLRIGVAFSIQEVDRVPTEAHDKPLDGILTEHGYRSFG